MALDDAWGICEPILQFWSTQDAGLSESDTPAKLIDPIFASAFGWTEQRIEREEPAGDGFVDYTLRRDGRRFLLVEAKRVAPPFRLSDESLARYLAGSARAGKNMLARLNRVERSLRYLLEKEADELAAIPEGSVLRHAIVPGICSADSPGDEEDRRKELPRFLSRGKSVFGGLWTHCVGPTERQSRRRTWPPWPAPPRRTAHRRIQAELMP